MNPWSTFAELETYLLACTVLYLNLLVLWAYGGLAGGRRARAAGRGDCSDGGPGAAQVNRRSVAELMFIIGLAAVLALMAQLIWRLA